MKTLLAGMAMTLALTAWANSVRTPADRDGKPNPKQVVGASSANTSGTPAAGGVQGDGASAKARQAAAEALLALLDRNFCTNKVDYHFNASGDSVCWATAGLAFIASGSTFTSGPHQKALKVIFEKLERVMTKEQFELQPVWGCAQATVFLAELHRTAPPGARPAVRELMEKYVAKLQNSQTTRGGWCHTFEDKKNSLGYDDLMATTVMALQGLGMARREGLTIDQKVIDAGLKYIESSSNEKRGVIGYSPRAGQKGIPGPGRTAGGLLALAACGQKKSPLSKAAAVYLMDSFVDRPTKDRPQAALNSGHASAQLGQMWAAWWAAENGCYDKYWAGQGALIMGRKMGNGGFKPAPSDGKTDDFKGQDGDFANAMHALMLTAADGRLAAGFSRTRTGPAKVSDAVAEADMLVEEWGTGVPECLKAFAAIGGLPKMPQDAELSTRLSDTVKQLAKTPGAKCGPAILQLLGVSLEGKGEVRAVYMSHSRTLQLTFTISTVRRVGLAQAKIELKPNDMFVGNTPTIPALVPNATSPAKATVTTVLKAGQDPPESLEAELEWDLAGLKFSQTLKVPLK